MSLRLSRSFFQRHTHAADAVALSVSLLEHVGVTYEPRRLRLLIATQEPLDVWPIKS